VKIAAINGVSAVLESQPKGCSKLMLKTGTFKAVAGPKGANDDMAQAVQEAYFATDAALNALLGEVGYKLAGAMITPA
jgi:hypothetical protein